MFCKYCGAVLDDDAVFCEKCGKPIAGREKMNAETELFTPAAVPQDAPTSSNSPAEEANAKGDGRKKRSWAAAGVAALVIAAAAAAVVFVFRGSAGSETGTTDVLAQNNFNNGGIFAFDTERQYFIGPFEDSDTENCLYSTDYEGNDRKLLSSESEYSKIRVSGDKLLVSVCDVSEDRYTLEMMNKDGSDSKTILTCSDRIDGFDRTGDKIIYLSDGKIHTCDLEGNSDELIADEAESVFCAGNSLYYTTEDAAYSYDFQKNEKNKLISGIVKYLCYDGQKLYYVKDDAVYEMELKTKEEKKLADADSVTSMLVVDDIILALHMLPYEQIRNLLKEADMEDYIFEAIGTGYLVQIPREGGTAKEAKDAYGGVALFGYPEDMYCRISFFSNKLQSIKEIVEQREK